MLEEYVGLDKKQIAYMKKRCSRWCTVFKNYPQVFLQEDEEEPVQAQGQAKPQLSSPEAARSAGSSA